MRTYETPCRRLEGKWESRSDFHFPSRSAQRAVRLPTDQNRPSHSCDLVGHGDDGAVPGRPSLKPVQPATELVVLSVYTGEDHTASINKESTQVGITTLADPKKSRFAVECCLGSIPSHAARSRLLRKAAPLPIAAVSAVAVRDPTPGMVSRRRQPSSFFAECASSRWIESIFRSKTYPVAISRTCELPASIFATFSRGSHTLPDSMLLLKVHFGTYTPTSVRSRIGRHGKLFVRRSLNVAAA
jgi:hypothetical protein